MRAHWSVRIMIELSRNSDKNQCFYVGTSAEDVWLRHSQLAFPRHSHALVVNLGAHSLRHVSQRADRLADPVQVALLFPRQAALLLVMLLQRRLGRLIVAESAVAAARGATSRLGRLLETFRRRGGLLQ